MDVYTTLMFTSPKIIIPWSVDISIHIETKLEPAFSLDINKLYFVAGDYN